MATCQNCNKKLSCGCQKRNASDGKSVCANCIGNYEMSIKKNIQVNKPTQLANVWRTKPNK
jgi:hypothetical protein